MNRPTTADSYGRRLQRVTEHIWTHLDSPLDLARLAEIACFSPFHFHRIYHAALGETVAETLARLRLQRAAGQLARSSLLVAEIGRAAGYGSAAAFSRAFRASYGRSPSAFRADRAPCAELARAPLSSGGLPMKVEIQDRPPLRLAAVTHRGPPAGVGRAFDRLMAWAGPQGLATPAHWGVAVWLTDMMNTPADEQVGIAGLTVGPAVMGDEVVAIHEIPGGRHAVVLFKGPFTRLDWAYDVLFAWLPTSGEEPAHAPMYEVNLNDPRTTAPDDLLTQVCLPLK